MIMKDPLSQTVGNDIEVPFYNFFFPQSFHNSKFKPSFPDDLALPTFQGLV